MVKKWLTNACRTNTAPTYLPASVTFISVHAFEWKWMDWDSFLRGKLNFASYWDHQVPSLSLFMSISWNMKAMLDSDQATFKLAKGTAAATDPADSPDRIPVASRRNIGSATKLPYRQHFADQSPVISSRILFYRHFDKLIFLTNCLLKMYK